MGDITLLEAKRKLRMWLDAEDAVATGKSYRIGTRQLERANLEEIWTQIKRWRSEIARLEGRGRRKVMRPTLRDL